MPFLTDLYGISNLDTCGAYLLKKGVNVEDPDIIKIGDDSGYSEISKSDGTFRLRGEATVWKDMIANLFGAKLYSTAGKVDYNYDEHALSFDSGGVITNSADRVVGNLEINHEFQVGNGIIFRPHFHWFQSSNTQVEMSLRYRLQRNGQPKTEAWTTITTTVNSTNNVWEYSLGTLNQITRFPNITVNCEVSDTFQFQLARTDSLGGTVLIYFFDLHGEIDSIGSNEVIYKEV